MERSILHLFTHIAAALSRVAPLAAVVVLLYANSGRGQTLPVSVDQFQHEDTQELMALVNDAEELVRTKGEAAWSEFRIVGNRWREGDTYIFVLDLKGKPAVKDEIALAMKEGSGWIDLYWYKPGQNTPSRKQTFVRKVQSGQDTYIVGSGAYLDE